MRYSEFLNLKSISDPQEVYMIQFSFIAELLRTHSEKMEQLQQNEVKEPKSRETLVVFRTTHDLMGIGSIYNKCKGTRKLYSAKRPKTRHSKFAET